MMTWKEFKPLEYIFKKEKKYCLNHGLRDRISSPLLIVVIWKKNIQLAPVLKSSVPDGRLFMEGIKGMTLLDEMCH